MALLFPVQGSPNAMDGTAVRGPAENHGGHQEGDRESRRHPCRRNPEGDFGNRDTKIDGPDHRGEEHLGDQRRNRPGPGKDRGRNRKVPEGEDCGRKQVVVRQPGLRRRHDEQEAGARSQGLLFRTRRSSWCRA